LHDRETDLSLRHYGWFLPMILSGRLPAQADGARPAVAVLELRFDGQHATVPEPGDTAIAQAATRKLLATLLASDDLTVVDSARVAAAVTAAQADGNPCDNACAVAVARSLGARWVVTGTVTKTSNLVWILTAELFDVAAGRPILADGYELKGDARVMGPAGAHVFAQRVERILAERQAAAR
jgi:TolB-like protein